jgi:L-fuconate dehydratase
MRITALRARDVRFPTSREMDGSDAMNVGDYSAVYVTLETDGAHTGHGLTFTNGHGTEIGVAAAKALSRLVVGRDLEAITADFAGFYHRLTQDPQLRWIGPEKGIVHMATGAVVNAVWDLWARRLGKPVWKLLADLTPQQTVDCVPFLWITDALTKDEALAILERHAPSRALREAEMRRDGFPA